MRIAEISRKTAETDIYLKIDLDGTGKSKINTGCGFLDHMMTLFAAHGKFDTELTCKGDTYVDYHHTAEDIGIVLGACFAKALGDKRGIHRYGDTLLPMVKRSFSLRWIFQAEHISGTILKYLPKRWEISTRSW